MEKRHIPVPYELKFNKFYLSFNSKRSVEGSLKFGQASGVTYVNRVTKKFFQFFANGIFIKNSYGK